MTVSTPALSMMIKDKEAIRQKHREGNSFTNRRTRQRSSRVENLNILLEQWLAALRAQFATQAEDGDEVGATEFDVTDAMIVEKARELASSLPDFPTDPKIFNFGTRWLQNLKKRTGLVTECLPPASEEACGDTIHDQVEQSPFFFDTVRPILTASELGVLLPPLPSTSEVDASQLIIDGGTLHHQYQHQAPVSTIKTMPLSAGKQLRPYPPTERLTCPQPITLPFCPGCCLEPCLGKMVRHTVHLPADSAYHQHSGWQHAEILAGR